MYQRFPQEMSEVENTPLLRTSTLTGRDSRRNYFPGILQRNVSASNERDKAYFKRSILIIIVAQIISSLFYLCYFMFTNRDKGTWIISHKSLLRPINGHNINCTEKKFKKRTLKLLYEQTFGNLFGLHQLHPYEASDITAYMGGDGLYVVFDNSFTMARIGSTIGNYSAEELQTNVKDSLLSWPNKEEDEDSHFEYIAYNKTSGRYIVGQEGVIMNDGSIRSRAFEVSFDGNKTRVWEKCDCEFEFSYVNKGFEGAIVVQGKSGRSFLIGLCEGNYCRGHKRGRNPHGGRLVVMERVYKERKCIYETKKIIKFDIGFQDYSAIALTKGNRIGILSQENAAVYIAELDIEDEVNGLMKGKIYDFPRNDDCEIVYCNLEGVYFLNERQIVAVSDSMKRKGRQHFRCRQKDESLHVFELAI